MQKYEYGAMSSKFQLEADNKLTAYAAMVIHFSNTPQLVAIYSPEEAKKDSWLMATPVEPRLDEIFGGNGEFMKYTESHQEEIKSAFDSIKRLV